MWRTLHPSAPGRPVWQIFEACRKKKKNTLNSLVSCAVAAIQVLVLAQWSALAPHGGKESEPRSVEFGSVQVLLLPPTVIHQ